MEIEQSAVMARVSGYGPSPISGQQAGRAAVSPEEFLRIGSDRDTCWLAEAVTLRTRTIMPAFRKYPAEAAIIGRLLAGYGELEVGLCNCVAMGGIGLDKATRELFGPRGEKRRIDTGERLGAPEYQKLALDAEFMIAVTGMRHCLLIRNQYAHCQWYDDYSPRLAFVNVENIAHQTSPISDYRGLTTCYVDVSLLVQQETFFSEVDSAFAYVNFEGQKRTGTLPGCHVFDPPAPMIPPQLHL